MTPDPKTVNENGRSPVRWLTDPFAAMGRKAINWVNNLGASTIFVSLAVLKIFRPKQLMKVLEQLWLIGAGSVPIIILVGLFTGMVLGLQSYHALVKFGSQGALGTLVALCVPVAGAANWTITQNAHDQGQDVDLVPAVLVGAVISTLLTFPLAFPFQASAHDVGLLAMLGAGQLAIPCVLSVLCARILKAPEMSLLALLEVIFGILLAWVGANEVPTQAVLAGGALVIGALLVNEIIGWRQRA